MNDSTLLFLESDAGIDYDRVFSRNVSALFNPRPVALVGASSGTAVGFATVAWATPISHDPAMVAVSLREESHTCKVLRTSGCFSINMLDATLLPAASYCGSNSGTQVDKSDVVDHHMVAHAAFDAAAGTCEDNARIPFVEGALSILDCEVESIQTKGDHLLICAYVTEAITQCPEDDRGRTISLDSLLCVQDDIFANASPDLL